MTPLVFDRTQEDADRIKSYQSKTYANLTAQEKLEWDSVVSKGAWNYTDINRVSEHLSVLKSLLNSLGYDVSKVPDTAFNWNAQSSLYYEDVYKLQQALKELRSLLVQHPFWEPLIPPMIFDYIKANALEYDLQLLEKITNSFMLVFLRSNQLCFYASYAVYFASPGEPLLTEDSQELLTESGEEILYY